MASYKIPRFNWQIKNQLTTVKKLLDDKRDFNFSDEDALHNQDILFLLLEDSGYIHDSNIDCVNWYRAIANLSGFEDWFNEEIKVSKRVTRRAWAIAIVCAVKG